MALLETKDLVKQYASQRAVNAIGFDVAEGSIFGLLGPNGAGKTTLLRMITGITQPDSGQILFEGRPFKPNEDVNLIGYMPEERGLYKKMKVGEQAVYLAQLKGLSAKEAKHRTEDWFERLQMQTWWNRKVEDLSKGMSQKLQFVTTVVHQPRLIILDEPFSGLDPVNSNVIRDEIFRLAKEGATIIFSTHRMEQVEEICDHIILMNKGQKILDGGVRDIRMQYRKHVYEVEFEEDLPALPQGPYSLSEKRSDRQYILNLNEGAKPNQLAQSLLQGEQQLLTFREILPSLHEIFIQLVSTDPASRQFIA